MLERMKHFWIKDTKNCSELIDVAFFLAFLVRLEKIFVDNNIKIKFPVVLSILYVINFDDKISTRYFMNFFSKHLLLISNLFKSPCPYS